jgi:hypothetical protein
MKTAKDIKVNHPWVNIVTTAGKSPWMNVANDGVVTISSMKKHSEDMEIIEVDTNHYEVLVSNRVVDILKNKLVSFK